MSENSQDNTGIKISPHPEIQKKVDEQRALIKEHISQLDDVTLNRLARHETAKNLKLDKRARETEKAKELSETDELTGLPNRRWFYKNLEMEVARANRSGSKLTLLAFDIDDFREINNRYGHNAGDKILRSIRLLSTRKFEPICRVGEKGDEFLQILNNISLDQLREVTSRYRELIDRVSKKILKRFNSDVEPNPKGVSISIGIAEYSPGMSSHNFVKAADSALYCSKYNGKNITTLATTTANGIGSLRKI